MSLADAAVAYRRGYSAGLLPDPPLWVDEWVDAHAYIPAEGNAEPGKYDTARTPFARQVMRVLSPGHPATRVVVMGASQLLKTQSAMNWMMASVDGAAANILALMPTLDLARRLSMRINNTLKATPKVRNLFAEPRSRHGKNTDDTKTFRGGTVYISTAGSAANLAEIPARYGYGDEIDDWEDDLQGQGDPIEIFENRGSTYGRNRKWYYSSSPKRPAEMSKIWQLFRRGNQQQYHCPCPHCDHLHPLLWENMRTDTAITRAWLVCPECGAEIDESFKGQMLRDAALGGTACWVAHADSSDGTESFTISQIYAPSGWTSWLELARLHHQATDALRQGDHTKMAAFYNTRLARCYDVAQSVTSADALKARAEPYPPRVVPDAALVLTAAVDTQDDRLEVQIEAWGAGMEHWIVDHIVLSGSPAVSPADPASVWAQLDRIVTTPMVHASGALIKLSAYGIDSGGHHTQDVYNYATQRRHLHCIILAGARKPNRPIMASKPSNQDLDWGGKVRQGAAELWFVGTDVAKDYLFNRIEVTSGPGAMHWHNKLPDEWFDQMCAERLVPVMRNGQMFKVWRKLNNNSRNEALDISVYNLAIAHKLRLHTWSHADWQRLREKLVPAHGTVDLFLPPAPPPADLSAVLEQKQPETQSIRALAAIEIVADAPHITPVAQPTEPVAAAAPAVAYIPSRPATGRRIYSRGIA